MSARAGWSLPRLWRFGTIAMILGAITWAFWACLDFGLVVGYEPDGSSVWPRWDATMILDVASVTLITVLLLGSSSYVLWRRSSHLATSWPVRALMLAAMAWIVYGSMWVVWNDKFFREVRRDDPIFAAKTTAWGVHLALSTLWLVCAAISLAAAASWLYASLARRKGRPHLVVLVGGLVGAMWLLSLLVNQVRSYFP